MNDQHTTLIDLAVQQGLQTNHWQLVSLLTGGWTDAFIYKIMVHDRFYIVKINACNDIGFNFIHSYSILDEVSRRGISPQIYFNDANHGVILMEHIDAKTRPPRMNKSIQPFAAMLRSLHQCQPFPKGQSISDVLNKLYQALPIEYQESQFIKKGIHEACRIQQNIYDIQDIKSSHCDITSNNVLFDGNRFYLIDWQRATYENFYFDLASCANFFYFYSNQLCHALLKEYFLREPNKDEINKFVQMRRFTYIYYGIGSIFSSLNTEPTLLPLSEDDVEGLATYSEYMQCLGSGKVNITNPTVRQQFGYVSLNTSVLM